MLASGDFSREENPAVLSCRVSLRRRGGHVCFIRRGANWFCAPRRALVLSLEQTKQSEQITRASIIETAGWHPRQTVQEADQHFAPLRRGLFFCNNPQPAHMVINSLAAFADDSPKRNPPGRKAGFVGIERKLVGRRAPVIGGSAERQRAKQTAFVPGRACGLAKRAGSRVREIAPQPFPNFPSSWYLAVMPLQRARTFGPPDQDPDRLLSPSR